MSRGALLGWSDKILSGSPSARARRAPRPALSRELLHIGAGEAAHERDQSLLLPLGEEQRHMNSSSRDSGCRRGRRSPPRRERRERAVVHVGRGQRDVAQRGRAVGEAILLGPVTSKRPSSLAGGRKTVSSIAAGTLVSTPGASCTLTCAEERSPLPSPTPMLWNWLSVNSVSSASSVWQASQCASPRNRT